MSSARGPDRFCPDRFWFVAFTSSARDHRTSALRDSGINAKSVPRPPTRGDRREHEGSARNTFIAPPRCEWCAIRQLLLSAAEYWRSRREQAKKGEATETQGVATVGYVFQVPGARIMEKGGSGPGFFCRGPAVPGSRGLRWS